MKCVAYWRWTWRVALLATRRSIGVIAPHTFLTQAQTAAVN